MIVVAIVDVVVRRRRTFAAETEFDIGAAATYLHGVGQAGHVEIAAHSQICFGGIVPFIGVVPFVRDVTFNCFHTILCFNWFV